MLTEPFAVIIPLYMGVLFILGLLMGSFLNVVAYRVPNNVSILRPPSTCPGCGKTISPRDNVPLLGWLLLRGKCRNCRCGIPIRYPLVELATGILWAVTGYKIALLDLGFFTNIAVGLVWLAFVSTVVVTFLTDYDYMIILDEISLGGMAASLILAPFLPYLHHAHSPYEFLRYHALLASFMPNSPPWMHSLASALLGVAVGVGFSLVIYYLGNLAFKKQIAAAQEEDPEIDSALGLGDVKLMGFYGALFGWLSVFFVYIVGSLLGVVIGSSIKLLKGDPQGYTGWEGVRARWSSSTSAIPFGPFLVAAALLYLFIGDKASLWLYYAQNVGP